MADPEFYHKTALSSHHLACLLVAVNDVEVMGHKKKIINNFNDAWNREGKGNEKESFISYIDFIIMLVDMVVVPEAGKKNKDIKMKALKEITDTINK